MAQQREQREKVRDVTTGHEGSRWFGERPSGEEVAAWFHENMRLDKGMDSKDWIGGITLISSTETTVALRDGKFVDLQRLVHVPYARVDARIAYFWALCEERGWLGEIEPVGVPRLHTEGYFNEHMAPGYWRLPIRLPDGKHVSYVVCTQKVTIYEPDARTGGKGRPVRMPPPASKQVPMTNRYGNPDENVIMKAETGAVGRALGMAGIFVLPGAGVATAEDMMEFLTATGAAPEATDVPELPSDTGGNSELQTQDTGARIADLLGRLEQESPEKFAEFEAWCSEKQVNPAEPRPSQARSILRKLESYMQAAS